MNPKPLKLGAAYHGNRMPHHAREDMRDIVTYRQAKRVEIIAQPGFAYSLDGEIINSEHFTVEIAEKALSFALPEE